MDTLRRCLPASVSGRLRQWRRKSERRIYQEYGSLAATLSHTRPRSPPN